MLRPAVGTPQGADLNGQMPSSASSPWQMPSSASSPRQMRDSPLLAHARRTQIDAQAGRTSARVRELMQINASTTQFDEEPAEPPNSGVVENPGYVPMFTGSPMRSAMSNRGTIEGDVPSKSLLLSRRPRSRSKDWRYTLESEGLNQVTDSERQDWHSVSTRATPGKQLSPEEVKAECEYQDWRSTSARFQPRLQPTPAESRPSLSPFVGELGLGRHATGDDDDQDSDDGSDESSSDMDPSCPFLREDIPSERTHPICIGI
jgi:hypothetical protein